MVFDGFLVYRKRLPYTDLAHELTSLYQQRQAWKLLDSVDGAHVFATVSICAPVLSGNALLLGTLPPTTLLLFLTLLVPPSLLIPLKTFRVVPHKSRLVDVSCSLWRGGIGNCSSNFFPTLLVPPFLCLLLLWDKSWFGKESRDAFLG